MLHWKTEHSADSEYQKAILLFPSGQMCVSLAALSRTVKFKRDLEILKRIADRLRRGRS